ncbi:hypothetical protein [Lacipirellula sp.]|uniref:hypothetical protein n=1 Tax=Lacipirellula sp. TaxID=2691419 RepID=UPI003D11EA63
MKRHAAGRVVSGGAAGIVSHLDRQPWLEWWVADVHRLRTPIVRVRDAARQAPLSLNRVCLVGTR